MGELLGRGGWVGRLVVVGLWVVGNAYGYVVLQKDFATMSSQVLWLLQGDNPILCCSVYISPCVYLI